jgi:phosphoglycolate phosphatase-like HAD superfamily hydrolase
LILGPAPIVDFDGTVARLGVDWPALRSRLGVRRISDLWGEAASEGWSIVTEAEIAAAECAEPVRPLVDYLSRTRCFAVLTDNSESAVLRFFDRFGLAGDHLAHLAGRETLGGPKRHPEVFRKGLEACAAATSEARGANPLVYVGDSEYELVLARGMGAHVLHIRQILESPEKTA